MAAALHDGVVRHFADASSRFVLADCGSTDDTVARVRASLGGVAEVVEGGVRADDDTICSSCRTTGFRERLVSCAVS
jgi:hypothetical protein